MQFTLFSIKFNTKHKISFFFNSFINNILFKPSSVKCYFLFIKLTNNENKLKSACFWVNKGYFIKCGIITLVKSFNDWTEYIPVDLPSRILTVTDPTLKNYLIFLILQYP